MDEKTIREKLIEIGYPDDTVTSQTASRLASFNGAPKALLEKWMDTGDSVEFPAIEGIDAKFLRDKLDMKEPAIIISYAMLLANPKENADYLKNLAENKIIFRPNLKNI